MKMAHLFIEEYQQEDCEQQPGFADGQNRQSERDQ